MFFCRLYILMLILMLVPACGDNLFPSGEDKRAPLQAGSNGGGVSQKVPDFSVPDSNGSMVTRADLPAGKKGSVLYFTMWCPVCDGHMNSLRNNVEPLYPGFKYYLVDYVNGSVADVSSAVSANGYAGGVFVTLADTGNTLEGIFGATMGTTVVIAADGTIRMNEDYKDGQKLRSVLSEML